MNLSSTVVASGVTGYTVGLFTVAWPNVDVSSVEFNVENPEDVFEVDGDVLRLQDGQSLDTSSTNGIETISVTCIDTANNQSVGPNNTNFNLQVVPLSVAPRASPSPARTESTSTRRLHSPPGVVIGSVTLDNPVPGDQFTFQVSDGRFQVLGTAASGYNLCLKPGLSLKYLDAASIPIDITATDTAGLSVTSPYTVVVNQVAQAPQTIELSSTYIQPGEPGVNIGLLKTFDPNVDPMTANTSGEYTYSVDDPRFQVVNSELELQPGQYIADSPNPITVHVTSTVGSGLGSGLSLVQSFVLATKPPVSVQYPAFPATDGNGNPILYEGSPASIQFNASGGNGSPYTFTVTSGTLPAGLVLSPSGLLSGNPTATGCLCVWYYGNGFVRYLRHNARPGNHGWSDNERTHDLARELRDDQGGADVYGAGIDRELKPRHRDG